MHCLICLRGGVESTAAALCPHCSAGLCLTHIGEAASAARPGGMRISCGHDTWATPASNDQSRAPQKSSLIPT